MVGKTLSHYKVIEKIGEGGMGEVYRAEDTNLSRDVAIKVLPEQFTKDPQRLARFEREAKLLASLNHPNIAAIHSFEHSDEIHFLVLELVPGETLAECVAKGPVPVEEALEVCRQIAEGVEAAHEKGVIHRDLKPANVKVTPEGKVKILDFGLAKAFEGETPVTDISQSPTLTEEMTRAGVILGTAAYMSPEQARGKEVNKQADIFSFGAILYELLTGKRAFQGETITETLAKILEGEPDWKVVPESVPLRIQELIEDCLEKAPDDRLRDIGNARIQIKRALKDPISPIEVASAVQPGQQRWGIIVGAALGAVVAGLAAWFLFQPSISDQQPKRLVITPLPPAALAETNGKDVAISPDGKHIVYRASGGSLYLRSLDDFVDRPIPGTMDAASDPFFSPDGESIVFLSQRSLKRVPLAGGSPITLCEGIAGGGTGDWFEDTIVFTASLDSGQDLYRVSATGGEPEILATVDPEKGEVSYSSPQVLPGGKDILFTIAGGGNRAAVLSLETGEQKPVLENARQARYLRTGHLLYAQSETGNLMVAPFDLANLEVAEDPVQVVQGVRQTPVSADYAVSDNGTLLYIPGSGQQLHQHSLVWVDREGKETLVTEEKRAFSVPRISPDGKKLAISASDETGRDLYIYDFEGDSLSRLTLGDEGGGSPVWSPDGNWLAFQSTARDGQRSIMRQPADRSRPPERLTSLPGFQMPNSWSPDGRFLAFGTGGDIGILPMDEEGEPEFIIDSPAAECCIDFSPDGEWIAYVSTELGQRNVSVRPFQGPDVEWLISEETEGGGEPVWSPDGTELFYRSGDKTMVVSIQTQDQTLVAGKPRVLFEGQYASHSRPTGYQAYDISPDGKRFLMMKEGDLPVSATQINVVLNWFEELKRLVPTP